MSTLFESMEVTASADRERVAGTRAVIAGQERAKLQFEKYIGKATSDEERKVRLSFLDDRLRALAAEVSAEHDFDNTEHVYLAMTAVLGGGHKSDCSCGFCANKGKLPGASKDDDGGDDDDSKDKDDSKGESDDKDDDDSGKPWESKSSSVLDSAPARDLYSSLWHTAVEEGDSYQQERQTVSDGPDASPSIDKSRVPASGLKSIDVGSQVSPLEHQSMGDDVDYGAALPGPSTTGEHQDADKSVGPPDMAGTDSWTGTEGQADPVTSRVAKWSAVE